MASNQISPQGQNNDMKYKNFAQKTESERINDYNFNRWLKLLELSLKGGRNE